MWTFDLLQCPVIFLFCSSEKVNTFLLIWDSFWSQQNQCCSWELHWPIMGLLPQKYFYGDFLYL